MKKYLLIFTATALILAACAAPALAAEAEVRTSAVELPAQVEIEKDNDVSAAMLSKLLGTEWQVIAGSKAADALGGLGKFAGVFVAFLNILNLLAMMFVAVSVMYHWGIYAVTSAHEGKPGGSAFNNLWVPIRQAFSFATVVPITGGGLSLLQAFIIAAVSLSINFANVVWDSLGGYLLAHVQTGVIDNVPPFVDEESLSLIRPMFRSVVAQEVAVIMGNELDEVPVQGYPDRTSFVGRLKKYQSVSAEHGGKYTIVREPLEGRITVYLTGLRRMALGDLGGVVIPYPVPKDADADLGEDDKAQFDAMRKVAEARATAVIKAWERLRVWSDFYLHDEESNPCRIFIDQQKSRPSGDGLAIAREYRDHVMQVSEDNLALLRSQLGVEKMLRKAIDSDGQESKLGWVSAGLMPFTFAQAQKRLDDLSFGGGATFVNVNGDYDIPAAGQGNAAIRYAPTWANDELLQGRVYQPASEEGDAFDAINRLIAGLFIGNGNGVLDNEGILSGTLQKFRQADPMVVISDFGRKLYNFSATLAGLTLGAAALSWVPMAGDALASFATSPAIAGAMYVGFAVAVFLYFLPPIAVLSAWIWALLKWALTIVYTLTGAPLWAVAHCAPEGQGFAGDHARQGYYILLDLLLRPALMTGGVVISMAIWQVSADLYSTLLAKYLNGFSAFNGSGVIMELIFSTIVFIIFGAIYLKIFTFCINQGPSLVMDLFGRRGASSLESSDHDGQHVTAASGLAVAKGGQMLGQGAAGLQSSAAGARSVFSNLKGKLSQAKGAEGSVGNPSANLPSAITAKQ